MHRRRACSLRVRGALFAAGALALVSQSRGQPQSPAPPASPWGAQLAQTTPGPASPSPRTSDPPRPPVVAPAPLAALGSTAALAALGPLRGPPGAWVEYAVRAKGRPPGRVRVSLLPELAPQGRRWLEIASASAAGLAVATKVLLRDDAAGTIERLIVLVAGQPPFELPLDPTPAPRRRAGEGHVQAEPLAEEQVTVPAGSFRASRVRLVDATSAQTVWRADSVPLWGIVRTRGAGGGAELHAYASTGAHSVFPGGANAPSAPAQGNGSESTK